MSSTYALRNAKHTWTQSPQITPTKKTSSTYKLRTRNTTELSPPQHQRQQANHQATYSLRHAHTNGIQSPQINPTSKTVSTYLLPKCANTRNSVKPQINPARKCPTTYIREDTEIRQQSQGNITHVRLMNTKHHETRPGPQIKHSKHNSQARTTGWEQGNTTEFSRQPQSKTQASKHQAHTDLRARQHRGNAVQPHDQPSKDNVNHGQTRTHSTHGTQAASINPARKTGQAHIPPANAPNNMELRPTSDSRQQRNINTYRPASTPHRELMPALRPAQPMQNFKHVTTANAPTMELSQPQITHNKKPVKHVPPANAQHTNSVSRIQKRK